MLKVEQFGVMDNTSGDYIVTPLSFALAKGEIVAIIGESGAGKSLLAQALLGDAPTGFSIVGRAHQSGHGAVSQHTIALAAQSASVFDPLRTVFSHLKQRLYHRQPQQYLASQDLARLQINDSIGSLCCHQLSGGMAKKALLAQAAIQQTDFLIADEPCNGLDDNAATQMYDNLSYLAKQQQQGILLISHNLRQVMHYADSIIVLKAGTMVEQTSPQAIKSNSCHPYTQALWQALPENWSITPPKQQVA
ncbi:ATP-binding cassette domain-containing protein [Shewanella marina]|uniref:ATP-binding cassette domain-containing protein n=1 Tax=Shewanella marina TaxID=487319 RepID=UPI000472E95E|nr:ATP-binding cassette domain-containing protein [Shewanella marina]